MSDYNDLKYKGLLERFAKYVARTEDEIAEVRAELTVVYADLERITKERDELLIRALSVDDDEIDSVAPDS